MLIPVFRFICLLLVVGVTACTLNTTPTTEPVLLPNNADDSAQETPPPDADERQPATQQPPTQAPVQSNASTQLTGGTACTRRTSWPTYTVAAGDTLAGIARRTGSTTAELSTANCLSDPNLISTGQALYVPRQPTVPTSVPPPSNSTCIVTLNVTTSLNSGPGRDYAIITQVAGADVFSAVERSTNGWYNLIVVSVAPYGGAWVDGTLVTVSGDCGLLPVTAPSAIPVIRGEVTITPNEGMDANWLKVMPGAAVEVVWVDTGTPTRVEFYLAPTGTGITPSLMGADYSGSDGWAIAWTVPQGVTGYWSAKAYFADGTVWETASLSVYVPA